MSYSRFAIYYVLPDGPLATFGAGWLGWDVATGREVAQPDIPGLKDITATPRKYGFHGTLKPPFRLKVGQTFEDLEGAALQMAAKLPPATCEGLKLSQIGRFLALTPFGSLDTLQRVAETCVSALDPFRAPAKDAELARRRKAGLSERQEELLMKWGYPYVFEEFRFHLTLSGRLPDDAAPMWMDTIRQHLPPLPAPFVMDQVALCGERSDGLFELLHRYTLAG